MAAEEIFLAINPDPTKNSVHLDKAKYDLMRAVILANLQEYGPMTFRELGALIKEQLQNEFGESVEWYFTTVKLDLEARGEIRRVLKLNQQLVELNICS
jgi:hypothetical protein